MKLYYGSKTLFQVPTYGEGNPTNDYGLGFYMTKDFEMAKLWATKFDEGGYVLTFNVNFDGLKILNLLNADEESILRWITLLLINRFDFDEKQEYEQIINWLANRFYTPISDYDVVIGYRADDSYFKYSLGFVSGKLSFEALTRAMKIGKLGYQYVLISQKAYKRAEFVESLSVNHTNDYQDFRTNALAEFNHLVEEEDVFKNTYIMDILRKYEQRR